MNIKNAYIKKTLLTTLNCTPDKVKSLTGVNLEVINVSYDETSEIVTLFFNNDNISIPFAEGQLVDIYGFYNDNYTTTFVDGFTYDEKESSAINGWHRVLESNQFYIKIKQSLVNPKYQNAISSLESQTSVVYETVKFLGDNSTGLSESQTSSLNSLLENLKNSNNDLVQKELEVSVDNADYINFPAILGRIKGPSLVLQSISTMSVERKTQVIIELNELGIPWTPNQTFIFEIQEGFVRDSDSLNLLSASEQLPYTTNSVPVLSSTTPVAGESNYNSCLVTLKFNRIVKAGTGNLKIFNYYTTQLISTINIQDTSRVNFRTGNCVVYLRGILQNNTRYYITVDAGAIKDLDNFNFIGITGDQYVQFQVGNDDILGPVRRDTKYSRNSFSRITEGPLVTSSESGKFSLDITSVPENAIQYIDSESTYNWQYQGMYANTSQVNGFFSIKSSNFDGTIIVGGPNGEHPLSTSGQWGELKIFKKLGDAYSLIQTIGYSSGTYGYGRVISISGDGTTIAATSLDGKVHVFRSYNLSTWSEEASFTPREYQPISLSLSYNGNHLIVGYNSSSGTPSYPGRSYYYQRSGSLWTNFSYIEPSGLLTDGMQAPKLSDNGDVLAIPAYYATGKGVPDRTSKDVSSYNTVAISTAQKKYGNRSIYFPGTGQTSTSGGWPSGDYVVCGTNFNTGFDNPYTVELWVYRTRLENETVLDMRCPAYGSPIDSATATLLKIYFTPSTINVRYGNTTDLSSPNTTTGQWQHIAVTKAPGGVLTLYVNGISVATKTVSTLAANATNVLLGAAMQLNYYDAGGNWKSVGINGYFQGYIDDLRFTKAVVYPSNFTPPTATLDNHPKTELLINSEGGFVDYTIGNFNPIYGDNVLNSGKIYVYHREGTSWALVSELVSNERINNTMLGQGLILSANGEKLFSTLGVIDENARIYSKSTNVWTLTETLAEGTFTTACNYDGTLRVTYDRSTKNLINQTTWISDNNRLDFADGNSLMSSSGDTLIISDTTSDQYGKFYYFKKIVTSKLVTQNPSKLSLIADKDVINALIDTIIIKPSSDGKHNYNSDYNYDFELKYSIKTPADLTDYKNQVITFTGSPDLIQLFAWSKSSLLSITIS